MPKILLSSVCQPFGEKHGDGLGTHYAGSWQILWAQGIYRPTTTTTQWGIDFIAENLKAPVVTLHYPTIKDFIKEIKRGYDYIGIAFVYSTARKMIKMVNVIRKHAPNSKIILGGYGTTLGKHLEPYADYICKEEGVKFMRKLLGEDVNKPIIQPNITSVSKLFSIPLQKDGYVFIGLGCPNGCDFCATSAFFNRKHIKFLPTGKSIYDAIIRLREINGKDLTSFYFSDEDFLLNKKQLQEFHQCVKQSELPPLSIQTYGSVKALSKLSIKMLVEIGVDFVWIGYEGKHAGYHKQQGKSYKELFTELKSHGISILASMILGFDYQTTEIIQEEFDELMELKPTMCQFLIYGPAFGTPLFDRLNAENRLLPNLFEQPFNFSNIVDGYYLGFKHPNIEANEMENIQRSLYKEEFARLGSGAFRKIEDGLIGYKSLKNHSFKRIKEKAEYFGKSAHEALQLMDASKMYLTEHQKNILTQLQREIEQETGKMTIKENIISKLVYPLVWWEDKKIKYNINQQPKFTRNEYRI